MEYNALDIYILIYIVITLIIMYLNYTKQLIVVHAFYKRFLRP